MSPARARPGFSLIEFIVWMVVISLAAAGLIPLVGQVLTHLHETTDSIQAHFLAQAVVEQMSAQDAAGNGFQQLHGGDCLQPDGLTPWIGADWPLTCHVDIWAAEPDFTQNSMACTSQLYADGDYKCAVVTVRHRDTNAPVVQIKALFARPDSH